MPEEDPLQGLGEDYGVATRDVAKLYCDGTSKIKEEKEEEMECEGYGLGCKEELKKDDKGGKLFGDTVRPHILAGL